MRRETSAGRMFHFIAAVTVIISDLWVIAGLSQFKGRSIFSFLNWIIRIMMDWQAKCCLMWFSEATKSKPEPPAPVEPCCPFSAGWLQTSAAFICVCFVCFFVCVLFRADAAAALKTKRRTRSRFPCNHSMGSFCSRRRPNSFHGLHLVL